MAEQIEQLTEEDRKCLGEIGEGEAALRIIDAQAAALATRDRRVAELERECAQLRLYGTLVRESFRRVRRQRDEARAERDEWRRARDAHEQNWLNEAARADAAESEVTRLRAALGRNGEEIAQVIRQRDDAQRDIRKLAEALAAAEERHTGQERRMNLRAEAAEARVRELEARCEALDETCAGAQHARCEANEQLAAANALLGDARRALDDMLERYQSQGLTSIKADAIAGRLRAHLSAQPAAATRTRAAAEQLVLDAASKFDDNRLRYAATAPWIRDNMPVDREFAIAELARRDGKDG